MAVHINYIKTPQVIQPYLLDSAVISYTFEVDSDTIGVVYNTGAIIEIDFNTISSTSFNLAPAALLL